MMDLLSKSVLELLVIVLATCVVALLAIVWSDIRRQLIYLHQHLDAARVEITAWGKSHEARLLALEDVVRRKL